MAVAKDAWACSRTLLSAIDRAMHARGLSNTALAASVKPLRCDEATIRNLRAGRRVRERYVEAVCTVLGLQASFRSERRKALVAADDYGGYKLSTLPNYEGHFVEARRSFSSDGEIVLSSHIIAWDPYVQALAFDHVAAGTPQRRRRDFQHSGHLLISPTEGSVVFLAIDKGTARVSMLTPLSGKGAVGDEMYGVLLTRRTVAFGSRPGVSAIVLRKVSDEPQSDGVSSERLSPGSQSYTEWNATLTRVEDELVKVAVAGQNPRAGMYPQR
ncbi:MAG: hypothetical protein HXY22_12405 [Alphaproteobacteria bacterium]|nr:hypothetical protein [Alphaproteobacteria bacterium]